MVTRVLVANRGEIARRVFATCRRLGLGTVAVYTDPDGAAPHVAEADARVRLPKTNDYLNAEAIIAAARAAGADAVHPGYGFLSENAEFAAAVQGAGLTWIGPPVDAVRAMGSKIESKKLMAAAGVPVLDELDPDTVTQAQLPVLVKASAGGGGRGMRVVRELSALADEVEAARREAQSAFGDPTVFCERYLPTGHHIEVQVMADTHGTVWAVGERECSIQRRHQKIIEEAPSPLVERTPGMRDKLFDAARLAAGAIGYTGAGTVEFLADDDGEFYFLEMNTRLQVEHPVTEETTGVDLVELQLAVADGHRLDTEPPAAQGHSIEARLYAEDPAQGWQPQAGRVHRVEVPGVQSQFRTLGHRTGIRVDSGIVAGSTVSIHYDPMLAKVISYGPMRRHAALVLADALARTRLHGVRTNRELLVNVLRHPAFLEGATDTAFFDTHGLENLSAPLADTATVRLSAIAAALADAAHNRAAAPVLGSLPSGWRNLASGYQVKSYRDADGSEHRVEYRFTRAGLLLTGPNVTEPVQLVSAAPDEVVLADDSGVACAFAVARYGDDVYVDSARGPVHLVALPRFPEPGSALEQGSLVAPMPGNVIRIGAAVGETVDAGQALIWLEAMKMEHTITAPTEGVLVELNVQTGQQVEVGTVLARVEAPQAEGDS
ncbi:biotin carboxylase N-terminal domain-containing protein [Mycobacterium nebraskense]|uniref:Biotin-dependent 3-methylcrotonyl-coenzyme A carboxylase alpha1 subunit n=1 Tax=Mycobacterium nebraskense TaxID=244292 RepID=A0A1X1ZKZ3_9MYCO|nr:biotin carboxylase N-terminal domain-containing protein [Mycobacterium nebraskense]KKC02329.1 acetyl-CoA carboxylase subunit alpha [Mycobacterium nebraskense]MBI2696498.1 biotin/lipoyl-binding protein [Mycobacterium nebraskense]MCV7119526.1 biotin/lipoyl-binding protein [Mycobacterium nebraskense]ORW23982.1 acetyl/propionyl-CoA carboxylase subuit alpha [Mycobacterium nebraskense]